MSNKVLCVGRVSDGTKCKRAIWNVACFLLFRPLPTALFWWWRLSLLRLFGAKIHRGAYVYSSVKIWAPWNLKMEKGACLGPDVICYNQAIVDLQEQSVVSQYSYLCTAGHRTDKPNTADDGLIVSSIVVEKDAWIGTRAFIGMGVKIGEGAIVGATASVYKDVEPYTIVGGNPAKVINRRNASENGK